jgi:hypothetical protein
MEVTMKTVNVSLRESDVERIEVIRSYLADCGAIVGARSTSQCVRYALEMASDTIQEYNCVRETKAGTGDR